MRKATASAPAKLIMFGEHAVVYGHPAVAFPLKGLRLHATASHSEKDKIISGWLNPKEKKTALLTVGIAKKILKISKPVLIEIKSSIPKRSGLGSSAAMSVAITRALADLSGKKISVHEVVKISHEMEKVHHGNPSGIDTAVIAHEKPVYFVKGRKPKFLKVRGEIQIAIAHSRKKHSTRKVVEDVRSKVESNPDKFLGMLKEIGSIAQRSRKAIETGDIRAMSELMNRNHELLKRLGVSSRSLDKLVDDARKSGATAAKMSGAGKGGVVVALLGKGQKTPKNFVKLSI